MTDRAVAMVLVAGGLVATALFLLSYGFGFRSGWRILAATWLVWLGYRLWKARNH